MVDQGQRKKADFYETPYSMTHQLLDEGDFYPKQSILEPACGEGAIVKVLKARGFTDVTAQDLTTGQDFTNPPVDQKMYDYIITNPPFSLALEFILMCKRCVRHKFALLLPLNYLHGQERYNSIWKDTAYPLEKVYVFTRYPMLGDPLREDGKYRTGMQVYAWYIWSKSGYERNRLHWIDNNQYVLKKGE
jgi:hypothetical protein